MGRHSNPLKSQSQFHEGRIEQAIGETDRDSGFPGKSHGTHMTVYGKLADVSGISDEELRIV